MCIRDSRPGPTRPRTRARALPAGRSTVSPSSRPGERRKRKMPRHPNPPFVTFRKTSPDKPILGQERTGSESGHRAKQPWPVPAQNPPSPVVSAPRIGQAHRLSAIPRPETVCQPATQHFRQKETDKREQAAEQTDESPIAYDRNTKARPRRCRQHVLVPTAGTRRKSPRDDCKNTHRKQTDESKNPPRSTADDPLSPQRQYPPERNLIGNKSRNSRNDTYRKQTGEPSGADGKWKDSRARIRDTLS